MVLPVVLPSPLVDGSSVLPVGGGGGTSAGGGVSVVGDGTSPVVDLPSLGDGGDDRAAAHDAAAAR